MEGITETDITYLKHPDIELKARIYRNKSKDQQPTIVDVHSGAWTYQDRTAGEQYKRHLAKSGFTVIAIDHRQGPNFKHPSASEDVESGIKFAHENAAKYGGDPKRIGLIGSSSGGHLALLGGITSKHKVDFIIACWPISDPAYRYEYAKKKNRQGLIDAHEGYFGTLENMREASVQHVLDSGKWSQVPPALIVESGEDLNAPREMTADLVRAYKSAGGYFEHAFYPGEEHCFGHSASPATDRFNELIACFALRHS